MKSNIIRIFTFLLVLLLQNGRPLPRVSIDGKLVEEIDMYSPWRGQKQERIYSCLSNGTHTIRITNTHKKNPSSSNYYINVVSMSYK